MQLMENLFWDIYWGSIIIITIIIVIIFIILGLD